MAFDKKQGFKMKYKGKNEKRRAIYRENNILKI